MKICILTLPLLQSNNYGCILQNYALQTALKQAGHSVVTEDITTFQEKLSFGKRLKRNGLLRRLFGKSKFPAPSYGEYKMISQHAIRFVRKYISMSKQISKSEMSFGNNSNFDGFVVGSDQVWRPSYTSELSHYFLDFTRGQDVRRVAYAASFGTDEWEFTPEQTAECADLIRKFDAVSVREDSGVDLCKRFFGVDAVHLLDPTMLLNKEDYIALVEAENEPHHTGKVMTYILDKSEMKDTVVMEVCKRLETTYFSVMPERQYKDVGPKGMDKCIYPSVTVWLRGFMDADYIVTDSFHGTVFSIIFNKPFIAIANKGRGLSRFTSLLKMFGLEDRLISSPDDLTNDLISRNIDFSEVNEIRKAEQAKALDFLNNALK